LIPESHDYFVVRNDGSNDNHDDESDVDGWRKNDLPKRKFSDVAAAAVGNAVISSAWGIARMVVVVMEQRYVSWNEMTSYVYGSVTPVGLLPVDTVMIFFLCREGRGVHKSMGM
jgi:hypothetical protein